VQAGKIGLPGGHSWPLVRSVRPQKIRSSHTDWPAAQHWLHSARLPLRGRSFEQQYFGGSL
jgi:hypothetical protein